MKPVNFDSQPCNPISSNCIVWQGPDIPCISLCTGDTISDVVATLATELCTVLDTLNVNNYDLSCFNITTCKPKDFIALIDFITKQVCDTQNSKSTEKSAGGCPDCMLSVPECLNPPQPVMNLAEYVNFLATKICGIIGDIADLNTRVDNLDVRVTYIEQHCCDDTPIPPLMVNVNCDVPAQGSFEITNAFESFVNDFFCVFYTGTTGTISQIESAIVSQCIVNNDPTKSDPEVVYGNLNGWVNNPGTLADTIRNIWLAICDLYNWNPEPASITLNCDVPSAITGPSSVLFESFINDFFCGFYSITGTTSDLNLSVQSQCLSDLSNTRSNPEQTYGDIGMVWPPETVADAITNIWIVLCDLYNVPTVVVEGVSPGITVTSATSGLVTTYSVQNNYLETFTAVVSIYKGYEPSSGVIPLKNPSSVPGIQKGQPISKYTSVYSNSVAKRAIVAVGSYVTANCMPVFTFGTFNNETGVFTITDPGTYLISANIHLKNSGNPFWSPDASVEPPIPAQIGSFILGITRNNDSDIYTAQGQTLVPNVDKCVEISTSKVVQVFTIDGITNTFIVKVLNLTARDYDGTALTGADFIQFSITKLRDNMTVTTCESP